MYRSLSETMRDPFAINTIAMVNELKIPISKSRIREIFYSRFKDKHILLLTEFQETLDELGITSFIAKVDYQKLKTFYPPFLLEMENDRNEDCFTLITKVDGDILYSYDINEKRIMELDASTSFGNKKCMVLLIDSFNTAYGENNFERNVRDERRSELAFAKNIVLQQNLLTNAECGDIIRYCENNHLFERSLVSKLDLQGNRWIGHSHVRTSFSADLDNYQGLGNILQKIETLLQTTPGHIAPVQCIRYEPTQQFKIHHDAADGDQRIRSVFIYLNENLTGGQTYFPEIDKRFIPKTGTCLTFPNLNAQLKRLPQSLHASLPVTDGVKYILTAYENVL